MKKQLLLVLICIVSPLISAITSGVVRVSFKKYLPSINKNVSTPYPIEGGFVTVECSLVRNKSSFLTTMPATFRFPIEKQIDRVTRHVTFTIPVIVSPIMITMLSCCEHDTAMHGDCEPSSVIMRFVLCKDKDQDKNQSCAQTNCTTPNAHCIVVPMNDGSSQVQHCTSLPHGKCFMTTNLPDKKLSHKAALKSLIDTPMALPQGLPPRPGPKYCPVGKHHSCVPTDAERGDTWAIYDSACDPPASTIRIEFQNRTILHNEIIKITRKNLNDSLYFNCPAAASFAKLSNVRYHCKATLSSIVETKVACAGKAPVRIGAQFFQNGSVIGSFACFVKKTLLPPRVIAETSNELVIFGNTLKVSIKNTSKSLELTCVVNGNLPDPFSVHRWSWFNTQKRVAVLTKKQKFVPTTLGSYYCQATIVAVRCSYYKRFEDIITSPAVNIRYLPTTKQPPVVGPDNVTVGTETETPAGKITGGRSKTSSGPSDSTSVDFSSTTETTQDVWNGTGDRSKTSSGPSDSTSVDFSYTTETTQDVWNGTDSDLQDGNVTQGLWNDTDGAGPFKTKTIGPIVPGKNRSSGASGPTAKTSPTVEPGSGTAIPADGTTQSDKNAPGTSSKKAGNDAQLASVPPKNGDKESGIPWWIIMLIVGGILLALFAIIGMVLLRRRRRVRKAELQAAEKSIRSHRSQRSLKEGQGKVSRDTSGSRNPKKSEASQMEISGKGKGGADYSMDVSLRTRASTGSQKPKKSHASQMEISGKEKGGASYSMDVSLRTRDSIKDEHSLKIEPDKKQVSKRSTSGKNIKTASSKSPPPPMKQIHKK